MMTRQDDDSACSDGAFAGADSSQLLIQVGKLLDGKGFQIVNIDAVMIAQAPKLKPFIPQIRGKIAASLSLNVSQVNIKATTEEGLGFTGTGEGISAQAVCSLMPIEAYIDEDRMMKRKACEGCAGCPKA